MRKHTNLDAQKKSCRETKDSYLAEKTTNKNKWEPRENFLKLGTEICKIMQILQSIDAAIHHPIRHRVMLKMLSTVPVASTATQLDLEKATNKIQKVILFGEGQTNPMSCCMRLEYCS